jgi:peptide/nickel transport system substrate-binding protein
MTKLCAHPDPSQELRDAYDFDRRDPLFGLSRQELAGPRLSRRATLRLLAAAGTLSAWHLTPRLGAVRPAFAAGGELRGGWSGASEFRTFDPAQINQVAQFQITSNVLSGLTHINPELIAEGDLAADWSVSDDGKEWTFNLREGVTFHNGDPFTAEDVVFTYNRSKDPEQSIHSAVLSNVMDVVAVDDHTVRIVLGAPQASLLTKTLERASGRALTIVSRGALDELGIAQYGITPVGTGPFRITSHQIGQPVVLERFEDYYDPERPKLDKVTVTPILEPEPLAAAIEAADIQIIGGAELAPELLDRFQANPDLVVSIVPGPGFQSIWLNPWREPFTVSDFNRPLEELMQEKGFKVRLAIAKAIDRERFIERAHFGRGLPAYGTINPAMGFFFDEGLGEVSQQQFDLAEARRLLAEAGYPDGEGFPKLTVSTFPNLRREVQVLGGILKDNLGIELEIEIKDLPVLLDQFDSMDYDIVRIGSGGDYDPDDGLVDWMQIDSKFNGRTRDQAKMPFGYFADAEVDRLIDEQRLATDLDQRKELVQQANRITSDKVASAFIYHPIDPLVYRKEVDYPEQSRIPGLVDLDLTTIGT